MQYYTCCFVALGHETTGSDRINEAQALPQKEIIKNETEKFMCAKLVAANGIIGTHKD